MRICLCTLCLNELAWLPKLYDQHRDWKGADLVRWIFVESADRVFADTNPHLVSPAGMSVDGTSEFLRDLAATDERVLYIPHGYTSHPDDPAQGKCAARTRYLQACESIEPDIIITPDADEMWPHAMQSAVIDTVKRYPRFSGYVFPHRDIWHPPSIADQPLFSYEAIGGFWSIPYCRVWRWRPGLRYVRNHNTPEYRGYLLDRYLYRGDRQGGEETPYYVHMAFASSLTSRQSKHAYYQARGEGRTDHRGSYVESRAAFETWRPGKKLPHGGRVIPYTGIIPEVFGEHEVGE